MNHGRDANVPIYLGPALLRLSFSPREGNAPFTPLHAVLLSLPRFLICIKEDRYREVEGTSRVILGRGLTNSTDEIDARKSSSGSLAASTFFFIFSKAPKPLDYFSFGSFYVSNAWKRLA